MASRHPFKSFDSGGESARVPVSMDTRLSRFSSPRIKALRGAEKRNYQVCGFGKSRLEAVKLNHINTFLAGGVQRPQVARSGGRVNAYLFEDSLFPHEITPPEFLTALFEVAGHPARKPASLSWVSPTM
jgi:hypothetical protein